MIHIINLVLLCDKRRADGGTLPLKELSPSGTGDFDFELAEGKDEIPFHAKLVAGKGYMHFPIPPRFDRILDARYRRYIKSQNACDCVIVSEHI
jgi:hypothetical protein